MDLSKVFSISGKPGLHELVATAKNGVLVETLETKKRFIAYSNYKISSLDDITIFTEEDDVPLKDVFKIIAEKNDFKSIEVPKKEELKNVLASYLPSFDKERVYESDIKKIFSWYNLLLSNKFLVKETPKDKPSKTEAAKKPAKKAAASTTKTKSTTAAKKPAAKSQGKTSSAKATTKKTTTKKSGGK